MFLNCGAIEAKQSTTKHVVHTIGLLDCERMYVELTFALYHWKSSRFCENLRSNSALTSSLNARFHDNDAHCLSTHPLR